MSLPLGRLAKALVPVMLGTLFVGGCADMMTYSKDSRREGIEMYNRGAYADAAGAFRNAVRQNPRDYRSYYYLGIALEQLGQYQQSIAAQKTAYQVITTTMEGKNDPEFRYRSLNALASVIARSDVREAELNAIEHRARTRSMPDDHYLLAKIYALRGDADMAMEAFTRACTIEPNNVYFAREAGIYYESIGQSQRAIPTLRRAYSLDPENKAVADALRRLGVVPGPSLQDEGKLAKPLVPKGPIPAIPIPGETSSIRD